MLETHHVLPPLPRRGRKIAFEVLMIDSIIVAYLNSTALVLIYLLQ